MRPEGCEPDLLRTLAWMPFLDRQEMVAVSGWSRAAVYEAVEKLETAGACASVLHSAAPFPPARRFHLTAAGLRRLADEEDKPLDAAVTLPDGKTVGIVRQGITADRSGFAKRLWRLREGPMPGAVLVLMADDVRLRHARRLLSTTGGFGRPDLETAQGERRRRPALPPRQDRPRRRASGRGRVSARLGPRRPSRQGRRVGHLRPHAAPLRQASREARPRPHLRLALDIPPGARRTHGSGAPEGFPTGQPPGGVRRLALTDRGLSLLARRDRTSVGVAKKRWSIAPEDPKGSFDWRNVTGRRTRQLLRNIEHTAAVHGFLAALSAQAPLLGWEVVQIDPPRRASRHFRHDDRMRAVNPDAFGVLRKGGTDWAFFLEWERRAVRPSTMSDRLAPYLRYYSSHRPMDDHGTRPAVLVVFDDEIAQTHFLRVAREEMRAEQVTVPLWVSHREAIDALGPLGGAWRTPAEWESPKTLPPPVNLDKPAGA